MPPRLQLTSRFFSSPLSHTSDHVLFAPTFQACRRTFRLFSLSTLLSTHWLPISSSALGLLRLTKASSPPASPHSPYTPPLSLPTTNLLASPTHQNGKEDSSTRRRRVRHHPGQHRRLPTYPRLGKLNPSTSIVPLSFLPCRVIVYTHATILSQHPLTTYHPPATARLRTCSPPFAHPIIQFYHESSFLSSILPLPSHATTRHHDIQQLMPNQHQPHPCPSCLCRV